jgi:uncharacterized protein (DUF1501 family)
MKRRDFLKAGVPLTTLIPGVFNGLSARTLNNNNPFAQLLNNSATNDDRVLVIIQMSGGNDGLNTVIPLEVYSNYVNARTNVAIEEAKALKLNGYNNVGLHPSLTGLQELFNDGKAAVIQSVGYPSPNFSHFRATDIWMSASNSNESITTGFAGRFLNYEYPNYPNGYPNDIMPDPLAIQIGSVTSLMLQGPGSSMGVSITNPTSFYNILDGVQDPVPNTRAGKELSFLRLIAKQTNKYGDRIKTVASTITQQGTYPTQNGLADQLKIVARLIKGGLKTKVYLVSMGGYDTHSTQVNATDTSTGAHANLLKVLSDATKAFMDDLTGLGVADRVVGMTFSEFGRRVKSNSSGGTDHGAAAPLFLFGNAIKQQVLGDAPALPTMATVNDNVVMQYDFRSIYATILEQWFCLPNQEVETVMLRNYQSLPLFKPQTCIDSRDITALAGTKLVSNYPNPLTTTTRITFNTQGGHTLIQIMDAMGRLVAVPLERNFDMAGIYNIEFDGSKLQSGTYYIRFQNQSLQQVRPMLKMGKNW